ncbi:ParB/RepB/Spo0J family partition protein [Pseudoglutamicibacter albus]|uniref:ParB/RepB/Spo0J family partition protein n=1 Tax=Pseudoglutamicibacter albus TaxID=98671 RepID=UPI000C757B1B|nr:ParB/RepB/Spo0J family partition protein [Pseudoglutamicibacter albus]PKY80053.1 hypothetical protein CYJ35_06525 [Pseudoglutamicibacter albus]WIK83531.1 ParB/RepB/Spo0J family partition protein [Pseudoglutamicibacter albus]
MAPPRRRGLGRGLGALIGSSATHTQETETPEDSVSNEVATDTTSSKKTGTVSKSAASAGTGKAKTKKSASTTKARTKPTTNNVSVSRETSKATSLPDKASSQPKNTSNKRPVDFFFTTEADRAVAAEESADKTPTQKKVAKPRKAMPDVLSRQARGNVSRGTEPTVDVEPQNEDENEALIPVPGATFMEVPVKDIHPNRKQPRQVFDEDELAELVHSIKEIGLLQPVVVRLSRESDGPKYELVMGERRWRATQEAGYDVIPAIIRETDDADLLRDALLENLHRSQLNPLEEAAAYQQLMAEFDCTQEELSERIGRSRPQISNTMRLLRLPALVQRRVAAGVLSAGHARAILSLSRTEDMEKLAQRVVNEGLSVRATEEQAQVMERQGETPKRRRVAEPRRQERLDFYANELQDRLETNVKITLGARKGRVQIDFASVDDLNRIMGIIKGDSASEG